MFVCSGKRKHLTVDAYIHVRGQEKEEWKTSLSSAQNESNKHQQTIQNLEYSMKELQLEMETDKLSLQNKQSNLLREAEEALESSKEEVAAVSLIIFTFCMRHKKGVASY
jgi:hypothetical protein